VYQNLVIFFLSSREIWQKIQKRYIILRTRAILFYFSNIIFYIWLRSSCNNYEIANSQNGNANYILYITFLFRRRREFSFDSSTFFSVFLTNQ